MDALIGYTGYIGSYLRTQLSSINLDCYNSKNIEHIRDKTYETLYFCGLPATKWLVNKQPQADYDNMLNIQKLLETCSIKTFVLISTIDVYDKTRLQQNEDDSQFTTEPYGKHRYMMEQWVCQHYKNHHILRLPALFGIGLKKNALFDLLTDNKACRINPNDIFQWYHVDDLYDDIKYVIKNNIQLINLFTEPISMKDVLENFDTVYPNLDNAIVYDFRTKHSSTSYSKNKTYILNAMMDFVATWRSLIENSNRMVVSNLCWKDEKQALAILNRYNVTHVELALTKYSSWDDINIEAIKQRFKGFNIYSLQALLYGKTFNVFLDPELFIDHFRMLAIISKELGVKRLVFGSPINRQLPHYMCTEDAKTKFINVFREIATLFPDDIIVCIEHNAIMYGCNFITTFDEAVNIVKLIDRKNIKVNYDTGNAMMMNETCDLKTNQDYIGHVQVSAPELKSIKNLDNKYLLCGNFVDKVSLEARDLVDFEEDVKHFVKCLP